jgi:protein-disulfide isomerase
MERVIEEYGKDGRVAWVYRHFPLDSKHSKARLEAGAAELAGEIGSNDKFWEYLGKIFEITPANNRLDLNLLPQIAEDIGLNRKPFEDLVSKNDRSGGKYASHIEDNYRDGITSGVTGTPYSIVVAPNGKIFTINGAQPYSVVKSIIELALTEK